MARDKQVNIVIRAKDRASKSITGLKSRLLSLKTLVIGGLGFIGFNRLLKETVGRAQSAETGLKKLAVAMRAAGRSSAENLEAFKDLSVDLERQTGIFEEDVLQSLAVLQTFGQMSRDDMEKTIVAAMDMATVFGETLQQSAIRLGKAYNGNLRGLQMMGIGIDAATFKAKGFQSVLDQLGKEQGGQAVARMAGFEGGVNRLTVALGEAGKETGRYITQSKRIREVIESLAGGFQKWAEWIKGTRTQTQDSLEPLAKMVGLQWSQVEAMNALGQTHVIPELLNDLRALQEEQSKINKNIKFNRDALNITIAEIIENKKLSKNLDKQVKIIQQLNALKKDKNVMKGLQDLLDLINKQSSAVARHANEEQKLANLTIRLNKDKLELFKTDLERIALIRAQDIKTAGEDAALVADIEKVYAEKRKIILEDLAETKRKTAQDSLAFMQDILDEELDDHTRTIRAEEALIIEKADSAFNNLQKIAAITKEHNAKQLSDAEALADKEISARQRVADKIAGILLSQTRDALRDEILNWNERNKLIDKQEEKATSLFNKLIDGSIKTGVELERAFSEFDKLKDTVTDVEGAENVLEILKEASTEIAKLSQKIKEKPLSLDIDVQAMAAKARTTGEQFAVDFKNAFEAKLRSSPINPAAGIKSSFTDNR